MIEPLLKLNMNNDGTPTPEKKDFIYYLSKYKDMAIQRDKGTIFESAVKIFLEKDAIYKQQFSKVLDWADWIDYYYKMHGYYPYPSHQDKGIDLVAIRSGGKFCAVQCKFKDYDQKLYEKDLDSFFQKVGSDTGRKYFTESIVIDTAKEWSDNLQEAADEFKNNRRISLETINNSNINWEYYFENGSVKYHQELKLRDYQQKAYDAVVNGFSELDEAGNVVKRGKLIMACGTGKTFVSLKITETLVKNKGLVLFLVPSLALINQTVKSWSDNADPNLNATKKFAVCSDHNAGKRDIKNDADENLSITTHDLYIPATTDPAAITKEVNKLIDHEVVIIFSTYQSLDQIITAQQNHNLAGFDLIICDEAHRTATLGAIKKINKDQTFFTKIHNNKKVQGKKRLYMTATPKVYVDTAKAEAKDAEADLYSMDDETIFGRNFYTYSFADAINHGQLTDYRVVLAKFEDYEYEKIQTFLQNNTDIKEYFEKKKTAKKNQQKKFLDEEDFYKLIAVYKQFCKLGVNEDEYKEIDDIAPMQKVMGFTSSIKASKDIKTLFPQIVNDYCNSINNNDEKASFVDLKTRHIDGNTTGKKRERKIDWLGRTNNAVCKLITNVNCLSEGVDVPALDGVVFFQPRQSEINIIQCIGRVLRKAKDKKWGYIMIPIFVPPNKTPQEVLENSNEYKKISRVINALRSIDEDFDSKINSLSLNPEGSWKKSKVIGLGHHEPTLQQQSMDMTVESNLKNLMYAKTVKSILIKKCVGSNHWEDWVNDVATKAKENRRAINRLIMQNEEVKDFFNKFQNQLKQSIHPDIKRTDVIDMVNQHFITEPIFKVLFKDSGALENNVIANSLNDFITLLNQNNITINNDDYQQFYGAIERKINDIGDDHNARQNLLHKIYESFFFKAFPRQQDRLGIIYTPAEIINFMLHSVEYLLQKEFNTKLENSGVSIIDPFTGTGSFLVHLINSGLISQTKLKYKYQNELFANEIMLLPYYIASVNIANAYNKTFNNAQPFTGICLTDTFEAYEDEISDPDTYKNQQLSKQFQSASLRQNYDRLIRQKKAKIKVIIGNPPYAGASNANENNQNKTYPKLEEHIKNTYAKYSKSNALMVLYNAYIKAIKWATLRLQNVDQGIIAFITPNGFLTTKTTAGMRKTLSDEFANIYIFDCKGDRNKFSAGHNDQGESIFNGIRTGVSMTFLVKNTNAAKQNQIHYYTFNDVYKQKEKLTKIKEFNSIKAVIKQMDCTKIDQHYSWINQDQSLFFTENYYLPLRQTKIKNQEKFKTFIFSESTNGIKTNRQAWCWNSSKEKLKNNITNTIQYYNQQREKYHQQNSNASVREFADKNKDVIKISWSDSLQNTLKNNIAISYNDHHIITALTRPFSKSHLYFDKYLNHSHYQLPKFFSNQSKTIGIIISNQNPPDSLSTLITDQIFDHTFINSGLFFPLSYQQENNDNQLIQNNTVQVITDKVLKLFQYKDQSVTKEMIFYYIYGLLHQKNYVTTFTNALLTNLPRIPKVKDYALFNQFYQAGKTLANIHLNYEILPMWKCDTYNPDVYYEDKDFKINKSMKIPKTKQANGDILEDLSTIKYNHKFIITNIPIAAYNYKLMNKPVIKLFLDKWQEKTDSKSDISNNPNDYAKETNQPRYILETLLRVINIALETDKLINSLPDIDWNDKSLLEEFK